MLKLIIHDNNTQYYMIKVLYSVYMLGRLHS